MFDLPWWLTIPIAIALIPFLLGVVAILLLLAFVVTVWIVDRVS